MKSLSLGDLVASGEALAEGERERIMEAVCRAVAALHSAGGLHKNIAPETVFVRCTEGAWSASLGPSGKAPPSAWSSPEALEGDVTLRPSTDVWSLGLVAFWLLSGRCYWHKSPDGRWSSALREEVLTERLDAASERAVKLGARALPEGFDAWFARCLAPEVSDRFRNGFQVFEKLPWRSGALDEPEVKAPARVSLPAPARVSLPAPAPGPFGRPAVRSTRRSWVLAALAVSVLSATAGVFRFARRPPPRSPAGRTASLGPATDISAGAGHACAVFRGAEVMCWGANNRGQLGALNTRAGAAVRVSGPGLAARVFAGEEHTCVRRVDGTAECFGRNSSGQLGRAGEDGRVIVPGVTGVTELALGVFHSCARLGDGSVRCWGANAHGQLGDGTAEPREAPVAPQDQAEIEQIAAGGSDTCAVRRGGTVHCWGVSYGTGPGAGPQEVQGLGEVLQVSVGQGDACALRRDETVTCWSAIRC